MTRAVPRSVILFACMLAIVTSIPYLVGWLLTPLGYTYTGAAALPSGAAVDYHSHLAKIWQGTDGVFGYQLLFTHEDHAAVPFVQGFYTILGALSPLSPPLTYHLARFVCTFLMVIALWRFGAHFFERSRDCWTFLLFSTLVTGVSWILLIINPAQASQIAPIELWLTDAYNLAGALFMPHFAAAVGLQIAAWLLFLEWIANGRQITLVWLTLALAALSIIQPYVILLTGIVAGAYALIVLIRKQITFARLVPLMLPFGLHAAISLYQAWIINSDPVWAGFSAQNITHSPPPIYYLLGYLPLLIPAALALPALRKQLNSHWLLPLIWIVVVALLLYAPIPTQRRYLLGVQTPLALIATFGWSMFTARWKHIHETMLKAALTALAGAPIILMIVSNTAALANVPHDAYLSSDETAAVTWLKQDECASTTTIFTTFDWNGRGSGGRLVAATGLRVYIGHWIETVDFDAKIENVRRLYDPAESDDFRIDLLEDAQIGYVWYDDYARAVGRWSPDDAAFLTRAFETSTVIVYRVRGSECDPPP